MYDRRDPARFFASIRGLTKNQLGTLAGFDREKSAQGVAPSTRYIYLFCLAKFGRFIKKPFKSATKDNLIDFFNNRKNPVKAGIGKTIILTQSFNQTAVRRTDNPDPHYENYNR